MKKIIAILSVLVCITVLVVGQVHWNNNINVSVASENFTQEENVTTVDKVKVGNADSLLAYTNNWPSESVETFQELLKNEKPFHIAFLGSDAQGEGAESWPKLVQSALFDTYGDHITISSYGYDVTSTQFINEEKLSEVIDAEPHLVIFEPFTLKDNGKVVTEDSLENAATVVATLQESLPDTVVILQPPHPLYKATHYPKQVEALAEFAADNAIPFLNHWESWPDPTSEEIKPYIAVDSSQPSVKGHQVWADYLIDYLIAD